MMPKMSVAYFKTQVTSIEFSCEEPLCLFLKRLLSNCTDYISITCLCRDTLLFSETSIGPCLPCLIVGNDLHDRSIQRKVQHFDELKVLSRL